MSYFDWLIAKKKVETMEAPPNIEDSIQRWMHPPMGIDRVLDIYTSLVSTR
jgi:hypothetical protein